MLLPSNASDPSSMIAQAISIFKNTSQGVKGSPGKDKPAAETAKSPGKEEYSTHRIADETGTSPEVVEPFTLQSKE